MLRKVVSAGLDNARCGAQLFVGEAEACDDDCAVEGIRAAKLLRF